MPLFRRGSSPGKSSAAPRNPPGTSWPEPLPEGLYLLASKRTMVGQSPGPVGPGEFPGYVYWEPPDNTADSGWRVFVGDETQDEANDPDACELDAVETLTTHHPQLRQLIGRGVTGAWDWNVEQGTYVKIAEMPPGWLADQ